MNMQTVQIMILLLDGFIKMAPWRAATEASGPVGDGSGKSFVRSLRFAIAVFAGF